jgi:hypothetical protein
MSAKGHNANAAVISALLWGIQAGDDAAVSIGVSHPDDDRNVGRHVTPHKLVVAERRSIADVDLLRMLSMLRCVTICALATVAVESIDLLVIGGPVGAAGGLQDDAF